MGSTAILFVLPETSNQLGDGLIREIGRELDVESQIEVSARQLAEGHQLVLRALAERIRARARHALVGDQKASLRADLLV